MEKELISIIVPIYNVESYLEKCINSIINQSYKNLEIILVDDGSTDRCGTICEYYKKKDNRIVVIHKNNEGLSSARNKGLDISHGKLIGFVDGDDFIESNMYEELYKNLKKCDSDIAVCNFYTIKNDSKIINNIELSKKNDFLSSDKEKYNNLFNEYGTISAYAWNKLYKKKLFDNIRFPEGRIYEYSYIICDILDKANLVSYTFKPLYDYNYRNNSIGNTFNINHFNKIGSNNRKIDFFIEKEYYDLVIKEKNNKMSNIINNFAKMKKNKIYNKEIEKEYYKELIKTNKEVKWKDATKINKFYKLFRKSSISILAFKLKIRDLIR